LDLVDVGEILDIPEADQRVLLHRAQARIHDFMERLLVS